jgi:hypothetical protein
MHEIRTNGREAAEDLFFGQVVMMWARWFLIAAGTFVALLTASDSGQLALAALPIVALMAMNFYLHSRYSLERPSNRLQVLAASAVDIGIITLIVLFWSVDSVIGTGFASPFFVFYYPVLLALAFVFPRGVAAAWTAATAFAYAGACVVAPLLTATAPVIDTAPEAKALVLRLVTLVAMGGLGTFYWRIQRDRRRRMLREAGTA